MLTQDYIDKLLAWEEEQADREITITVKRNFKQERTIKVFCWDSILSASDTVTPPAMPDIAAAVERNERAELGKLQAKYGKVDTNMNYPDAA